MRQWCFYASCNIHTLFWRRLWEPKHPWRFDRKSRWAAYFSAIPNLGSRRSRAASYEIFTAMSAATSDIRARRYAVFTSIMVPQSWAELWRGRLLLCSQLLVSVLIQFPISLLFRDLLSEQWLGSIWNTQAAFFHYAHLLGKLVRLLWQDNRNWLDVSYYICVCTTYIVCT